MAEDYREKIKKLLALAESDNEHEAKSALLKAKALMAEHKLTEADCKDLKNKKVKHIVTEVTYSKRRDPWMCNLYNTISENYCCQGYEQKKYDMQTRTVAFVGLEDDVELCVAIFKYAVDCIHAEQKRMKKDLMQYSDAYRKSVLVGYGSGFVKGIKQAFEIQKAQNEVGWGLVMVMPAEVEAETKDMKHSTFSAAALDQQSHKGYMAGLEDGKKFDPGTKLQGEETKEGRLCLA
jgi:hypothetical protein